MVYRPPALDIETDGMLEDYCEAFGDANKAKIIFKAIQSYVLAQLGRNEGARDRYIDLRAKRSKPRDDAANSPSTDAKPGE